MNLHDLVPPNVNVLFACIGTDRSTGDSLGPIVGTWLEELGHTVIGTLEYPLHALNLEQRMVLAKEVYPNHLVVAIDACLVRIESVGQIVVQEGPLFPGKALKKELMPVGDISIKGIVNVGGFLELSVLQSTRLNVVWEMAKEITEMCDAAMKAREKQLEVAYFQ